MEQHLDLYIRTYYTFLWDPIKSERLKKERGVSFEEIVQRQILAIKENPTRAHQVILLFEYDDYVWVAPCVAQGRDLFLKTLFPSRKLTKLWIKK